MENGRKDNSRKTKASKQWLIRPDQSNVKQVQSCTTGAAAEKSFWFLKVSKHDYHYNDERCPWKSALRLFDNCLGESRAQIFTTLQTTQLNWFWSFLKKKQMWIGVRVHTDIKNFRQFFRHKNAKILVNFGWGAHMEYTSQTAQIKAIENHLRG